MLAGMIRLGSPRWPIRARRTPIRERGEMLLHGKPVQQLYPVLGRTQPVSTTRLNSD